MALMAAFHTAVRDFRDVNKTAVHIVYFITRHVCLLSVVVFRPRDALELLNNSNHVIALCLTKL